jgi:hypothetical protein
MLLCLLLENSISKRSSFHRDVSLLLHGLLVVARSKFRHFRPVRSRLHHSDHRHRDPAALRSAGVSSRALEGPSPNSRLVGLDTAIRIST